MVAPAGNRVLQANERGEPVTILIGYAREHIASELCQCHHHASLRVLNTRRSAHAWSTLKHLSMARNEEKNYTILNRLYLENQAKLSKDKKPERPNLNTLTTAAEVKKWIPGIKWEINFCLHHLSGIRNYPDYKIREFQERLEQLKVEYKRWVKRTLELDPDTIGVPGNPHIYHSKKTVQEHKLRKHGVQSANPNGYTKLYYNIWQVQQAQAKEGPAPPPEGEEGEEDEYPEDGGFDYFDEAGGIEGMPEVEGTAPYTEPRSDDLDSFATPLAIRPEGYHSDEEKAPQPIVADPTDPQNQPLAFNKKRKPEDFVYSYSNKRPAASETKENAPSAPKQQAGPSLGLAGLADYGSDDE
eukprot:Phypoly_transcript_03748.p2 GENE.Phypoly_transcript_03748~~Phypoly_transcript_03748.p2  ORF type:complete len:356 (-),score=58.69 Phypoly_transcript_03748:106-1173(-)